MTELLYLKNSYIKEFEATVVSSNNNEIVLDKTVFYPQGGGQIGDTGTLTINDTTYIVLNTVKKEGFIIHQVSEKGLNSGDIVRGIIDWQRRYTIMRMHTACHVLSSVFVKEAGALITGNQLDLQQSRVDFNLENFDREKIQQYINKANDLLATHQEIAISVMPRAKAEKIPELAKLA
ncbi:MAG: alanyl-tRNA editing protein, partial [Candidatus Woesearchaeota archaeon]